MVNLLQKLLYNSDYVNLNQKQWEADDILDNHDIILNSPITEFEVRKSIGKLKNGKAPGKDGISAEFYKLTCHIATPILALIFNEIFNSGTFPKSRCESILVPIYKSGSHDDPSNYRGISLINVMYKIFSSILNDRIYHWADSFELIDESQAGFGAGYSVIDNLFTLQSMIEKYIGKAGGRFYVLYVDFKKAFDSIVHDQLFNILLKRGLRGKMFYILLDMYSNLRANLRVSDKITAPFLCNIGTRQRDISSPIIFNLFIQELSTLIRENCPGIYIYITDEISPIPCLLYADDVAHCADTVNNLQLQLNKLSEFCHETKISVNLNKTEIMVFRNGGPLKMSEKWYLDGLRVRTTSVYKYMGLLLTPKLSWSASKYKLASQAKKAISSIKSYQYKFGYFLHNEYFKLFDAMVLPILTFGAELWGYEYSDIIENVQLKFCREFLGVNHSVNNCIVLYECGRLPLCVIYKTKVVKYWCKLLRMDNHRFPKQCYMMLNPFPNKPWFLRVCSTSLLETLWEKEKLLVTSNFSFFRSVFCSFVQFSTIFIKSKIVVCKLFQFGRVQNLSFGKGLRHIPILVELIGLHK